MRLLVDAMSVNNLSGRYVLAGHLRQMIETAPAEWRICLLTHRDNAEIAADFQGTVEHVTANIGGHWLSRYMWTRLRLAAVCRQHGVDVVFNPSGMLSAGCTQPQVVLAQNPVPLIGKVHGDDRVKHWLQRLAFQRAHEAAAAMVFNSQHMRELYSVAFGVRQTRTAIAYQGLPESAYLDRVLENVHGENGKTVLAVSVMARHKAIEVLVDAFALLAQRQQGTRLVIVGGWPEPAYRAEIELQILRLGLIARIEVAGHVSEQRLRQLYRTARVFCLLSRCESFGIPALEAQAAGTPCVVANGTAAPEITGAGAIVVDQDDAAQAACALEQLLVDDQLWAKHSAAARSNAERFRWSECSGPLIETISKVVAAEHV